jgi:hypothetical protein
MEARTILINILTTVQTRSDVPRDAGGAPRFCQISYFLSERGGADYARHITTGTPGFSDLPTALQTMYSTSWTSLSHYRDQFHAFNCNL